MDRFEKRGSSLTRDGVAKERGLKSQCTKKIIMLSTDQQFLFDTAYEISTSNSCYEVEIETENKLGVYALNIKFTNDDSLGDTWAQYQGHPKVWVTIDDETFSKPFQSRVRDYSGIRK